MPLYKPRDCRAYVWASRARVLLGAVKFEDVAWTILKDESVGLQIGADRKVRDMEMRVGFIIVRTYLMKKRKGRLTRVLKVAGCGCVQCKDR